MKDKHINIERLMTLARIALTEDEKHIIADSLDSILGYFQELSEVNVDGVEESAHAHPLYNVLREDEPGKMFTPEEALMNVPEKRDNQVVVPKIVE